MSGLVETFRVYEPLRRSPEAFAQVRLGEYGADVVWSDDIDMSADTLWRLAQEQSGATMSPDAFRRWRERKALTLDAAARALGVSRRMVAYYEQGAKPIPRVVALATRGLEHGLISAAHSRTSRKIMIVDAPCAMSRPRASTTRPSAETMVWPALTTRPSARTIPVSGRISREKLALVSMVA